MLIRPMQADDWMGVRQVLIEGLQTGVATLEVAPPDWPLWDMGHLRSGRLVAEDENGVLIGWVALTPVSSRRAYSGVAEVSIYVSEGARGHGVGTGLLMALIAASEAAGIWTLQASILAGNEASLRLHGRCGFRTVGLRERIGWKAGRWLDVWLLERRSSVVGVDEDLRA